MSGLVVDLDSDDWFETELCNAQVYMNEHGWADFERDVEAEVLLNNLWRAHLRYRAAKDMDNCRRCSCLAEEIKTMICSRSQSGTVTVHVKFAKKEGGGWLDLTSPAKHVGAATDGQPAPRLGFADPPES